ncbi:MAG: zinc-binding dehydrogenase, partial [Vulcanimicrobiaceae bacterium]
GLMHVAVARALGVRVVASDFLADRRARALALGAEVAVEPEHAAAELRVRFGEGPAVVVCGPGSAAALAHALESVWPDGTVVMFTPLEPGERVPFDQSSAYFRDLRLVASYSCGPEETHAARAWIETGIVTAERLGARHYPLEAAPEAYRAMRAGEIVKAIVSSAPFVREAPATARKRG